jgi:hypothetical protein
VGGFPTSGVGSFTTGDPVANMTSVVPLTVLAPGDDEVEPVTDRRDIGTLSFIESALSSPTLVRDHDWSRSRISRP